MSSYQQLAIQLGKGVGQIVIEEFSLIKSVGSYYLVWSIPVYPSPPRSPSDMTSNSIFFT